MPLAFSDVRVDDYMSAMIAVYELQDVRPLIDLYVYSYMRTAAAYDSTVKSMGFDEVRVRYRQERRKIIREIISQELTDDPLIQHVNNSTKTLIPSSHQKAFKEDVLEDLEQIDISRLAGIGVTPEQLKKWKQLL